MSGRRIVAPAAELKDAEPVTKRVAQRGLLPPTERLNVPLKLCSRRNSALNRGRNVIDFKVEMDRCPMSTVVANRGGSKRRRTSGRLGHQVDPRGSPGHLGDRIVKQPSLNAKTERRCVEHNGAVEVVDVDVDEKLQG